MTRNINIYIQNDITHISVLGELQADSEVRYLWECIHALKEKIQITFYDAHIIPEIIVETIIQLQKRQRCRVYVFERSLRSYLVMFGIRCQCMELTSINQGKYNQQAFHEEIEMKRMKKLLNLIYEKYGYDYREYDMKSIQRRIKRVMEQEDIPSFDQLEKYIVDHPDMFEKLFIEFSINTTDFFRNPEVYQQIIGNLFDKTRESKHIKVWCAGCSTGEEPYSLAILLHEHGLLNKTKIYATDINPYIIQQAKNGLFPIGEIERSITNYGLAGGQENFTSYFEVTDFYIKVKDFIKKNILFFQHNLGTNSIIEEGFQLILCRNVFIYFNQMLQSKVLKDFHKALGKNGYLILGKSEGLIGNGGYNLYNIYKEEHKIYCKKKIDG